MAVYAQITTVCNMRCRHCCHDCGPVGDHMPIGAFRATLKAFPFGCINIGGGEPTCHPDFWEILSLAVETKRRIWMTTNGKRTSYAVQLADMAERGLLECGLSQDEWHEPISQEAVDAFSPKVRRHTGTVDQRFIHNIGRTHLPIRAGRCDWGDRKTCVCCDKPFVKPDGNVYQCGCHGAKRVGTVFERSGLPKEDKDLWPCSFGLPNPNRSLIGKKVRAEASLALERVP